MPERGPILRCTPRLTLLLLAAVIGVPAWAQAQTPSPSGIYTCIDDKGRRLTSDRPIAECNAREQQILNKDGSVKAVKPPTPTAEERAEREARERKSSAERMAQMEATRRDKNLLARFPTEAAHQKARESALDTVRLAVKATEARLSELQVERKPLLDEAEFYKGKALPPKLKAALEANDAATEAQKQSAATQQAEIERVNRNYDIELSRLQRLWAGAPPGSLGPLQGGHSAKPVAKAGSGA
ncbi:MAG: hypothetical protein U1F56_15590 [Rubrivivax sp.]